MQFGLFDVPSTPHGCHRDRLGNRKYSLTPNARKDHVEFHVRGSGFTWQEKDKADLVKLAREAFVFAREKVMSGHYDMVVLDELTYLINYGMVSEDEVLDMITRRPAGMHLVISGRDAAAGLIEAADLVSEVRAIKHPYEAGVRAQMGIEF